MDFSFTEAQEDLAGLTRRILHDQLSTARLRAVEATEDRFDRTLWNELADAGILSAALAEQAGGSGFGVLEQCSVLVELGRAVAPTHYLTSITGAAATIAEQGTDEQCKQWAVPAARGEVVLTAALAEEAGEDPASPVTRAEPERNGWRLDGVKCAVPAAGVADLFLVSAHTPDGPALFLVEPDAPGLEVQRQRTVDNDSAGLLTLRGTTVSSEQLLGGTQRRNDVLAELLERLAIGTCAAQLGVVERALELTSEYARERVQFDRPIGSFQAVAQRLADAYIDVEAVRLSLWQAAWQRCAGMRCAAETATAKFWAAEGGHRVAHTAVHVHGGVGIDVDHELHRYFIAAKRNEFELGGATTHLLRIGQELAS